ncbi:MAG: hypothetical protein KA604_03195 [Candidatus Saccharimonas sp.]|nr:hypothetical protein [Candidatus Saccharimonas sp.]
MADTYKVAPMPPTLEELTELLQKVKAIRGNTLLYLVDVCYVSSDKARNTALVLQALQGQVDRLEREIEEISRKPKSRAANDIASEIDRVAMQHHDERPDRGPRGYM